MKALLFFFVLSFSVPAFSQGKPDSLVWRYVDLSYVPGGVTSKSKIKVDYGDEVAGWFRKPQLIESPDGKSIKFKSVIDALNFMSTNGWELVQNYVLTDDFGIGKVEILHFIMRRLEPFKMP